VYSVQCTVAGVSKGDVSYDDSFLHMKNAGIGIA